MSTTDRLYDRGTRLGEWRLRDVAADFRHKRMELGLSQRAVARAARISRSSYSRIERGKRTSVMLMVLARIATVLGLDLVLKTYPGGAPLRDTASAGQITYVCGQVARPLRARTEVPLPQRTDHPEQRRWDVLLSGSGRRTGMEFETRLYDAQAQHGRWNLKMRDDPVDSLVVVISDTRRNREVLRTFPELFADLPRLGSSQFLAMLRDGQHPPTGLVLLPSVPVGHHPDEPAPTNPPTEPSLADSAPDPAHDQQG
jgi:transcriptional regulator with XRE-family HTH domain